LWSDGQATQTATGLIAGTYSVLVTDANGCTSIATATISQATALSVAPSQTNVLCNGGSSGTATPNVSGGNPAYSYSWSNGQTNQTAIGLSIGSYTVVVTDSKGCTTNTVFNITEPTVLSNSVSQTNLTCFNVNNGSATATPSGGTPNYSYSWSPVGGNAATANNLGAGNYVVTVTDANGCTTTSSVTLTQPAQIISTYTATNVLCNGQNNGSATLTTNGGNPAYTYAWSPSGGNAATANNLGAGNYVVTVSDASGCTSTVNVNITQPNALAAPVSVITPKCNGQNNGSATATPSGGTSPYTYSWSTTPVQNTQTANNLSAGNYNVTVTDANGCSTQIPVQVTQPGPIMVNVSGNDSVCAGDSLLLSASVNGGTPAYTYAWSPTGSGQNIYVFPTTSTTYSVVTTDANGCSSVTQTFNVNIFPKPTAMFDTASGGMYSSTFNFTDSSTNASSYYWNFGDGTTSTQQNPVHNYTIAGTYTVTEVVFNQFGCPDTFKRVITFNEGILIPNVFTPDGDGVNDVWYIPNSGMKSFHVEIYNRWGEKVFETTADEIRWDGRSTSGQLLNDGTYYFTLKAFLRSPSGEKDYSTSGYVTLLTRRK
jgi:gliding motility-associated-like protein